MSDHYTPGAQRAALALFESGFVASNGPDVMDQLARIIDATTGAPELLAAAERIFRWLDDMGIQKSHARCLKSAIARARGGE